MKIAPVAEVKARFGAYLKTSEEGPVIVTRNGRPVAVLISVTDEQEIE
jgi:prevent-host-death family protein